MYVVAWLSEGVALCKPTSHETYAQPVDVEFCVRRGLSAWGQQGDGGTSV